MKDSRYEEALERAKELHKAGNALTRSQMEIVFPELKESEDERIRRQIEQTMIDRVCDMLTNYVFEDVTPQMIDHFRKRLEKEYGCNQPKREQPEVDLEKEIDDYIASNFSEAADGILLSDANSTELQITDVSRLARHFYELGLNARKEGK